MAGLDGVKNKIDPVKEGHGPYDFNLFNLSEEEKANALALSQSLAGLKAGPWSAQRRRIVKCLEGRGLRVDYVEAVDSCNLRPVKAIKSRTAVLLAVYDGKTRLIDNRVID
jgi:pantothenate synthetase